MTTKFSPKNKIITGTKKNDIITWISKQGWKNTLTVNAGNGKDKIDFKKSNYKNILNGQGGNDTIYGGKKNDKITGGKGNDVIYTGKGTNTVIINKGDNNDTIYHQGTKTTVQIKSAKAKDKQTFAKKGNDLIMTYAHAGTKTKEVITFKNYFTGNKSIYLKTTKVQKLWNLVNSQGILLTSSAKNAKVNGSAAKDIITVKGENSTINGGKDDDVININVRKATVKIQKGGGNDTINLNADLSALFLLVQLLIKQL